ncbi:MAG: hypothetical protein U1F65_05085 [Verrucomicrobiota bacterium]
MPSHCFLSHRWPLRFGGAALLAFTTWRAQAQWAYPYDPDWTRSFRAGVLVGFNIKADFRMSGNFGVSPTTGGTYDDGYVRRDDGGALTSNWGYNNASQYNATSETLTMHRSNGFTTTSSASVQNSANLGLDLAYNGMLWHGQRTRIGWELGFGWLPLKISDRTTLSATVSRLAYTFDAGGIVMPPAGYQGTPNSSGPVISSTPTGAPVAENFSNIAISGSRTLDVNFFALKLGPTIFWDVTPYIGLSLGAGPAVGFISGDLRFNETILFSGAASQNTGSIGSSEITYGGYVNATVTFHTVRNGDFYVGAQYMPMGRAKMGNRSRQADLDLRGQIYVMAGINWPF